MKLIISESASKTTNKHEIEMSEVSKIAIGHIDGRSGSYLWIKPKEPIRNQYWFLLLRKDNKSIWKNIEKTLLDKGIDTSHPYSLYKRLEVFA